MAGRPPAMAAMKTVKDKSWPGYRTPEEARATGYPARANVPLQPRGVRWQDLAEEIPR